VSVQSVPKPEAISHGPILRDVVRLCRPEQWTKNAFVAAPLVFSWSAAPPGAVVATMAAVGCFCLWSSAVYCLNDVLDAPSDRSHPRKSGRPVASGQIYPALALTIAAILTSAGLVGSYATLPQSFLWLGAVYLVNSGLYCVTLKTKVIVDVLSIAAGFVLRLLAGCAAIGVSPTSWILVCGFSLALLLGFGKRRLEVASLHDATPYRAVLQSYTAEKLNLLLGITASMCLLSYMLYTVSPDTVALHKTDRLIYTVPIVAYGVFRYLFKAQEGRHDGPAEVFLKDPVFALVGLVWCGSVVLILYVLPPLAEVR
jgi:decaprenyl-phosphate phosphoribosyltransferase